MKKIAFVTLFPDWIQSSLGHSILARAASSGLVEFSVVNPRNYCYDPHKKVDDVPYGGHPGMLMKAEPVALAIEAVVQDSGFRTQDSEREGYEPSRQKKVSQGEGTSHAAPLGGPVRHEPEGVVNPTSSNLSTPTSPDTSSDGEVGERSFALDLSQERGSSEPGEAIERSEQTHNSKHTTLNSVAIILTEPSGIPFTQAHAEDLATYDQVIFVCGHYEGIDHRIEETFATHVFSIGDYVLTNGEFPALVMADAITRLIPGVLGNENSLEEESFQNDLLGAPNYTRPEVWRGIPIPDVLKSGNHKEIDRWRLEQAKQRTQERRPDLVEKRDRKELS